MSDVILLAFKGGNESLSSDALALPTLNLPDDFRFHDPFVSQ
jgi:hypothetical protein